MPSLRRVLVVSSDAVLSTPAVGGPVHTRRRDADVDAPSMPLYALSKLGCEGVAQRCV